MPDDTDTSITSHGLDQLIFEFGESRRAGTREISARLAGQVLHRDRIDVSSADRRAKFAKAVAARLRDLHGIEKTASELEGFLLRSVEDFESEEDDESSEAPQDAYSTMTVPGPDFGVYKSTPELTRITNFIPLIETETLIHDAGDVQRTFVGKIILQDREKPWKLEAQAFASDQQLKSSLYETAGVGLEINCRMDDLRNAIGKLSEPEQRETTVDFGWSADFTVFRVPGANITVDGWQPAGDGELTVDLTDKDIASHLQLMEPIETDIQRLKTDVIPTLLRVAPAEVTFPLLAFTWLPILAAFIPDVKPFCLWMVGPSGVGKSYAARLFQRFYGAFHTFLSWTGTSNSLQMVGYYFRNSMALIDDYKPETVNQRDVVRLIQNYADGSARSRLRKDATLNWSRPFRGWIVSSGEDLPERSASMIARCVIGRVRQFDKNLEAARICAAAAPNFPKLTSAFIQHVLRENRRTEFMAAVEQTAAELHAHLVQLENGARIAANFALLAAAFREAVVFLIAESQQQAMLDQMRVILDGMVREVVGETTQQAIHSVFLDVLQGLLIEGAIRIIGFSPSRTDGQVRGTLVGQINASNTQFIHLNLRSAIAAVDTALKSQGKAPLACSPSALLRSLHSAGLLCDQTGQTLARDYEGPMTLQTTINHKNWRCVIVRDEVLGIVQNQDQFNQLLVSAIACVPPAHPA